MTHSLTKAKLLLSKMTLQEKIGQMVQFGKVTDAEKALIRQGRVGSFLNTLNAQTANELQRIAVNESRLGIPLLIGHDILHGHVSTFPISLAEACSFNLKLIEASARQAMIEAAADGFRWNFAPMVDIARDPRWGRIAESAGEDPFYGGLVAQARVRGFQSLNDDGYPLGAACAKHYIAYGAVEGGRDYNTVDLSEHVLRTTYLPPFKAAVDAGVMTIMSSFNDLFSVPASANDFTLREILKGELDFKGFVVSDWESVEEVIEHGIAQDDAAAALAGLVGGVDMDMHSGVYLHNLEKLAKINPNLEALIDDAALRILNVKYELGLFDKPYTDPNLKQRVQLTDQAKALTLDMARESIVLLKNSGVLPLDKQRKIALIGPFADDPETPIGSWGLMGSPEDTVTVVEAFRSFGLDFVTAKGCDSTDPKISMIEEALECAQTAEVIVLTLGETRDLSGENNNRAYLDLPGAQLELLKAMKRLNKPIVTLLFNGRPMTIPETVESSGALLAVWHLGLSSGTAITETLLGINNPSGKLVTTFPKTVGQIPLYYNHKNTGRPGLRRYVDCDETPLFPFGFGLSYSTFHYRQLTLKSSVITKKEALEFSVEVLNTSDRDGQEVVQVYYRDLNAMVTRPVKELCAFEKLTIKAHQTKSVSFRIPARQFGYYDPEMNFVIEPGIFIIWVGPDSTQGLSVEFSLV